MKTLIGTPDQPRPRNEITWTNGMGTTASASNVRIDWAGVNVQRTR